MSLLWTPVAMESVLAGMGGSAEPYLEIRRSDVTMLVQPLENGIGRIERVLSLDPQVYLQPEYQPGRYIPLYPR